MLAPQLGVEWPRALTRTRGSGSSAPSHRTSDRRPAAPARCSRTSIRWEQQHRMPSGSRNALPAACPSAPN
eukprot:7391943-Prymnesium_polylepis.1